MCRLCLQIISDFVSSAQWADRAWMQTAVAHIASHPRAHQLVSLPGIERFGYWCVQTHAANSG